MMFVIISPCTIPGIPGILELAFKYIMLILDVSRANFKTNWPVAET